MPEETADFHSQDRPDDAGHDLGPAHSKQQHMAHSRRKRNTGEQQVERAIEDGRLPQGTAAKAGRPYRCQRQAVQT